MGIEPKPFVVLTGDAPDYLPITMACVSCVSPTFFQPVGSGSHLYPAHRNTVRSGHGVEGLTDSRGSFPLGLPCPRLLYPYCITTWEICQEVFSTFFGFQLSCESNRNPASLTALDFSYIVPHIGRFVKGFQKISSLLFESIEQPHAQAMSLLLS